MRVRIKNSGCDAASQGAEYFFYFKNKNFVYLAKCFLYL